MYKSLLNQIWSDLLEQLKKSRKRKRGEGGGDGAEDQSWACEPMNRAALVTPRCSVHNKTGKKTGGVMLRRPIKAYSNKADLKKKKKTWQKKGIKAEKSNSGVLILRRQH